MPLIYYRSMPNAEVALWRADESTDFFKASLVAQDFPIDAAAQISHPEKAHQWYASRYLLCEIYPDAIQMYRDRMPYLYNGPEISLSHSKNVVAVLISQYKSGIDVQWPDPKLKIIANRFLSPDDMKSVPNNDEILSLSIIWSIKEAVFKYYGTGLAFKNIKIESYDPVSNMALAIADREGDIRSHKLVVDYIDGMSLAYVIE